MTTSRKWQVRSLLLFCSLTAVVASAQTFTVLHTFDLTDGAFPFGTLVQGLDGNFYGTTQQGNGQNLCSGGCGTVFKITPQGTLTTLHNFDHTDGGYPTAALLLGTDGNFYGSTNGNGNRVPGFVFEITPAGTLTNLALNDNDSVVASALLENVLNGTFYGAETQGCNQEACATPGFLFSISPGGPLTILHNFCGRSICGGAAKGYNPQAPLIQGSDSFMYGTTTFGEGTPGGGPPCGLIGCGTVFKIGTGGVLTTVHNFDGSDGAQPAGGLMEGSDGNFYGTTKSDPPGGSVFRMTPAGELTTIYAFCSTGKCTDGSNPVAGVIQATDGNFYGTTENGGAFGNTDSTSGYGTVFQLTPNGTLTTLHSFDATDGVYPQGGLVQGTDGNLYGVGTGIDAIHAWGTIFKITTGLAPFVKTVPVAANPGKQIFILGTNLTGTTSVTFNGTSAAFTVVSATEITATVPKSATTGTVQVVTPGGTLSSNVSFRVF